MQTHKNVSNRLLSLKKLSTVEDSILNFNFKNGKTHPSKTQPDLKDHHFAVDY